MNYKNGKKTTFIIIYLIENVFKLIFLLYLDIEIISNLQKTC